MKVKVDPNFKVDKVSAPASKSYAQRAIFAASLGHTEVKLINIGQSDDVQHIIDTVQQLGAKIETSGNDLLVLPRQHQAKSLLNCGESGLGIRLTTSIASTFGDQFEITGSGSLTQRPMNEFAQFLPDLGVTFESNNGFLPLRISNKLKGGNTSLDGSISSQFLSGLLMALPLAQQDSVLTVDELKSIPYVKMTLALLNDFGITIEHQQFKTFNVASNQQYASPNEYQIEGDWSGAAFWIVYGLIANPIAIQGLNKNSLQADRAILQVLDQIGAKYQWKGETLKIQPSELIPFDFDATHCPDLFPILATLAASIKGISKIHGVNRLAFKESDRATVIQKEFHKLGLSIEIEQDTMHIKGGPILKSAGIHSHNDHRIAMSFAIASCLTKQGLEIEGAECVAKSYPGFWDVFKNNQI